MTAEQKTCERYEFMCEDGADAMLDIHAESKDDSERKALLDAALALEVARNALSHAYDVVGATAKEQRRNDQ